MRGIFASFDDALIERLFQPVSDLCADRFGLGRARVACLCVDIASVGWILAQARALSAAVMDWEGGVTFCRVVVLLIGLLALLSLRVLFSRTGDGANVNPLRPVMRPYRAIVLSMLVARAVQLGVGSTEFADLGDGADVAMLLFAAMALYLGACTERPPVRRTWFAVAAAGAR